MVESFTDQFAGRQQNTRGNGWQRVEFRDQCGSLFLGYPPMQDKQRWNLAVQGVLDGIEMFGALGQHQHLPSLAVGVHDLGSNRVRSGLVDGKVSEYILNPRFLW